MESKRLIETGVDKLVRLVKEKSSVTTQEAGRILGLNNDLIMEWALFLEEEGIINIQYKLTSTVLVARILTPKDILSKQKELGTKKEVVLRKANILKAVVERETQDFEKLNKEFFEIKKEVDAEIGGLQQDLREYERLKVLKDEIEGKLRKGKEELTEATESIGVALAKDKMEYLRLLQQLKAEEEALKRAAEKTPHLIFTENVIKKQLAVLQASLKKLNSSILNEDEKISATRRHLEDSRRNLVTLKKSIVAEKEAAIKALEEKRNKLQAEVMRAGNELLDKLGTLKRDDSKFAKKLKEHTAAYALLSEKARLEKMIDELQRDNELLNKEVDELINKIKIAKVSAIGKVDFDEKELAVQTKRVGAHVESFQQRVKDFMHFGKTIALKKEKKGKKEKPKKRTGKARR